MNSNLSGRNIKIDHFQLTDRSALRAISYATSFMGQPELFVEDRELICDALTGYFTDYEPESIFIAKKEGESIGYITGAVDVKQMRKVYARKIIPGLLKRFFQSGFLSKKPHRIFVMQCLKSFFKGEFFHSEFSDEYPALLHLNIAKKYRKQGVGRLLLNRLERYLSERHVKGIHLSVMSDKARDYFKAQGFHVLHEQKRTYLRYALKTDFKAAILGKKLR